MVDKEYGDKVCLFCESDKDILTLREEDGTIYTVEKSDIIRKYEIFMKKLLEKDNVKKFIKGKEVLTEFEKA